MKDKILGLFLALMLVTVSVQAKHEVKKEPKADSEVYIQEVIDTVKILPFSETAIVNTRVYYLDADDNELRHEQGVNYIFKNRADDPDTPEDETSTAYDDFISGAQIKFDKIVDKVLE